MKKYIIITLLTITQVFYLSADFNSSKSQLQQQINAISNDLTTLDKLDNENPSGYDAQIDLNTQIGMLLIKTRLDLKAATNTIQQIQKLKLNAQQSQDFQKLKSQFNQYETKWNYQYKDLFSPIS